jgi:hypothetical protein
MLLLLLLLLLVLFLASSSFCVWDGDCVSFFLPLANNSSKVPYKESKLTEVLRDCIGGGTKTTMIAHVTPYMDDWKHSMRCAGQRQSFCGFFFQCV